MPVKLFTEGVEPADQDAPIWRFMNLRKFKDLFTTSELFFNRAVRFPQDEQEGIPPEEYIVRARGLNPAQVKDFHRRKVDMSALITEVVVNPKATRPFLEEIAELVTATGHAIPVRESALARHSKFLPF